MTPTSPAATESWEEMFSRYRKKQVIESSPSDYIHVGLNSAAQFSDLLEDIRQVRAEAVAEERARIRNIYPGNFNYREHKNCGKTLCEACEILKEIFNTCLDKP